MNPEQAISVAQFMIPALEEEFQTTRRVLAAVPDDKADYKPDPTSRSAAELAAHLAQSDIWFLESITRCGFEVPAERPAPKPSESVKLYESKVPGLLARLKELSGDQLAAPVQFFTWNLPLLAYIQLYLVHSVHHRGQLSAYLRPMGAKVPSIYGDSADEPIAAAAS